MQNKPRMLSKIKEPIAFPGHHLERRQWKRKYISIEGRMRIICALDQKRSSRWQPVLIKEISAGGIKVNAPFVSLDDIHVVGDLTEPAWMPNILDIELNLPTGRGRKIFFQGIARFYLSMGVGLDYVIGVSISSISNEDRKRLSTLLGEEGLVRAAGGEVWGREEK